MQQLKRLNQTLHTWLGIVLSLWVLLMAITGTALYFKSTLLKWHHPQLDLDSVVSNEAAGRILDSLPSKLLSGYAYMPTTESPWLEVVDGEGTHWYYAEQGVLLSRAVNSDYIGWFVSLHHDLMLAKTGKDILGILGLASLVLVITGIVRWWPRHRLSRRHFSIRWHSLRGRKGLQTLSELHKVSAIVMTIPILLVMATGTAVIYAAPVKSALIGLFPDKVQPRAMPEPLPIAQDWQTRLRVAQQVFPSAQPRLIYLSKARMRLKHSDEWHPNGRNYLGFSTETGQLTQREDVRETAIGNQLSHTIYPLHAAAVGGAAYLTLAVLTGLTLILLPLTGLLFYFKRRRYRQAQSR